MPLEDALALLLLLGDDEPRFDRAVVRWHALFCLEVPAIGPSEAQLAFAALSSLSGRDRTAGAAALIALCERHGLKVGAETLRRPRSGRSQLDAGP